MLAYKKYFFHLLLAFIYKPAKTATSCNSMVNDRLCVRDYIEEKDGLMLKKRNFRFVVGDKTHG